MAKPWTLTCTIQDDKGAKRNFKTFYEASATYAEVEAWGIALGERVTGLIGGNIVSLSVTRDLPLPDTAQKPIDPDSDVEEKLFMQFQTVGYKKSSFNVPSVPDNWFFTSAWDKKRKLSLTDPTVTAFRNHFALSVTLGFSHMPTDSRGDAFRFWTQNYKKYRK